MKLHYEKHHSDIFCINNPKETLSCIDQMSKVVEIQKPIRLRKRCIKPKLPKNFWPCSICGNSFSNYLRYYRHLKEVHEVSDNQVIQDTAALENSVVINEALSIEKMKKWDVLFLNPSSLSNILNFSAKVQISRVRLVVKPLLRSWLWELMKKLT